MSLKSGIIGLPNVGKSMLFNALSHSEVPSENFPFCTIEPNLSIVNIPDPRLQKLAQLINPEKVQPATINFVDIAGLVKGASQGEGLGNQFLAHIREVNQLIHVVRCFDNEDIIHVAGSVDPAFDKAIIDQELQLKDLATLNKKLEKLNKLRNEKTEVERKLVETYRSALEKGKNARNISIDPAHLPIVETWQLLTQKPVIYLANVDEESLKNGGNTYVTQLQEAIKDENAPCIMLCASLESQLAKLSEEERKQQLEVYHLTQTSLDTLIQTSYKLLHLITYFTAGEKEVKAWPITQHTTAPQAAGHIHTDLEKGFIRAQVIKLDDYLHYQSEKACKQAGKIAIQGKKYVVQDADIIHFICKN